MDEQDSPLLLKIPIIRNFRLTGRQGRFYMTSRSHTFHPPGPVGEWPKTVADVGDSFMRHTLADDFYGPGAVGSIHLHYAFFS
jgi:hypothetical protein